MDEEPNPTKDILYEVINQIGESKIHQEIAYSNHEKIINEIIELSKEKIQQLDGEQENNLAKFLTAFLHYLLTIVLIPSQRKIQKDAIDIDIVVPNLKTLETNPKNAILICIPEIHEYTIESQIKEMNSLMQIFVMTSHSTLPHVIQCMQGGAYDFFEKPLKIEDILISLGEAARRATRWSSLYSNHSLSVKEK